MNDLEAGDSGPSFTLGSGHAPHDADDSLALLLLVILLISAGTAVFYKGMGFLAILLVLLALPLLVLVVVASETVTRPEDPPSTFAHRIGRATVVVQTILFLGYLVDRSVALGTIPAVAVSVGLVFAVVAFDATRVHPKMGRWSAWTVGGAFLALGMIWVLTVAPNVTIDVVELQQEATARVLNGVDPYLPGYPNIYSQAASRRFYAPELVDGDTLNFGLPYPPASLLAAVPGGLVGDVRFAHVAALALAAVMIARTNRSTWRARTGAALLLTNPMILHVVENGWTETFIAAALAAALSVRDRGAWSFGVALGVLVAMKQYAALIVLPLYWWLFWPRPGWRWKTIGAALATVVVVTGPFAVWHPSAFWFSVVEVHLRQPFRPDSLSLPAVLSTLGVEVPPDLLLPLAGVAVLAAMVWLGGRGMRTWAQALAGVAVLLLVFFLFAKQAFVNYYVLLAFVLCAAVAVTGESDSRGPTRTGTDLPPT